MGMAENQKCKDSRGGRNIFQCFEYHTKDREVGRKIMREDQNIWSEFIAPEDVTVCGC